jgi:hypothetical protein
MGGMVDLVLGYYIPGFWDHHQQSNFERGPQRRKSTPATGD